MNKIFNERATNNLIRLTVTSQLTEKELVKIFNITLSQLRKCKQEIGTKINIEDKDWIYGALRTMKKPNAAEIADYIDYKNKIKLREIKIKRGLMELLEVGLAYKSGKHWNYCQRSIEVYSNRTEKFKSEVELADFNLSKFKTMFRPKTRDHLMYEPHWVTEKNAKIFKGIVSLEFDFKKNSYDLSCRQGD